MRAFLYRLGVRGVDLDDATQEVFLAVIRSLNEFELRSRFRTWVYGIAVNVARALLRRSRTAASGELPEAAVAPDPAADLISSELGERVRVMLLRLPDPLREAFVLRHVEGFSVAAAAAALAVPEGTLKRHAFEARDQLRARCADFEATR